VEQPAGVARGVLEPRDRQVGQQVDGDAGRGGTREVVGQQWSGGRLGDRLVVRPRIGDAGRRQRQDGVGADVEGTLGQLRGLPPGGSPGAGEHGYVGRQRRPDRTHEGVALFRGEGGRLPRRSGDQDAPHAEVDQLRRQGSRGRRVQCAVLAEERDQGDPDTGEEGRHGPILDQVASP
jgi:hypothetical protein